MSRKTVRFLLIAGIMVMGLGIIGYAFYAHHTETRQRKAAESSQLAEAVGQDAAKHDENQTTPTPWAEDTKTISENEQVTAKAEEKFDQPSQDNDANLLEVGRKALDNPDVTARVQIVRKLRNEKSEESVELLYTFLNDDNKAVIGSALNSLAFIGKDGPLEDKVYGILIEKAKDEEFYERGQALIIAAHFDKDYSTLPIISDYVSKDDEYETGKRYAVKALAAIANPECVEYLKAILKDSKDPDIHRHALHTLSRIESDEALELLEKNMHAADTQAQLDTTWALSQQNKPEYNQILAEALTMRQLNEEAITIVARNAAGPVLLEEVLASNAFDKKEKISILEIYAKNLLLTTNDVRSGVAIAVRPLLDSDDPDLQVQAIRIMGMGFGDEETVDILKPKLQSSEDQVRMEALNAYRLYISEDNYKSILDMVWDQDETIRRNALTYTAQFIDESDRPLLEEALNHEDEVIRQRASQILN